MTWLAVLIKPFVALFFLTALAFVRWSVIRWMPDSKLKRFLLRDV